MKNVPDFRIRHIFHSVKSPNIAYLCTIITDYDINH